MSVMNDQGRQRTTKFVAKKFAHLSEATSELEKELDKNKKLLALTPKSKTKDRTKSKSKIATPSTTDKVICELSNR